MKALSIIAMMLVASPETQMAMKSDAAMGLMENAWSAGNNQVKAWSATVNFHMQDNWPGVPFNSAGEKRRKETS